MSQIEEFFGHIVPARIDEPTHATLELPGDPRDLRAIVVPRIAENGDLSFDFFDIADSSGSFPQSALELPRSVTLRFLDDVSIKTIVQQFKPTFLPKRGLAFSQGKLLATQREVGPRHCQIRGASFCIQDFPKFFGSLMTEKTELSDSEATYHRSSRILGYTKLEAGGWEFTIAECPNKDDYGITHTGSIRRADGQAFSVERLRHTIDGLTYFLTFVTGVYRTPSIVVGYDAQEGNPVWGRIASFGTK